MSEFLQQLLNGLSLGAIYALIALGYTMVYGVLRFINFAHSDVFMVGAYIGYYIGQHVPHQSLGGGLVVLAAAMAGCGLLGMGIERFAYRRLRSAPTLNVLITAIGVSLLLEYSGQLVFGAAPRTFPDIFPSKNLSLGGIIASSNQLVVIGVAILLMIGLQFIVFRTKIGMAMRSSLAQSQGGAIGGRQYRCRHLPSPLPLGLGPGRGRWRPLRPQLIPRSTP